MNNNTLYRGKVIFRQSGWFSNWHTGIYVGNSKVVDCFPSQQDATRAEIRLVSLDEFLGKRPRDLCKEQQRFLQISSCRRINEEFFENVALRAEAFLERFSVPYCVLWPNGENCESFTFLCLGLSTSEQCKFRFTFLEAGRIARNWCVVFCSLLLPVTALVVHRSDLLLSLH